VLAELAAKRAEELVKLKADLEEQA
jgi:hypothetical protein